MSEFVEATEYVVEITKTVKTETVDGKLRVKCPFEADDCCCRAATRIGENIWPVGYPPNGIVHNVKVKKDGQQLIKADATLIKAKEADATRYEIGLVGDDVKRPLITETKLDKELSIIGVYLSVGSRLLITGAGACELDYKAIKAEGGTIDKSLVVVPGVLVKDVKENETKVQIVGDGVESNVFLVGGKPMSAKEAKNVSV